MKTQENTGLLNLGRVISNGTKGLEMSRGDDCFNIGTVGGCGINCPLFLRGECENPEEIKEEALNNMPDSDIIELSTMYDCFKPE